MGVCAKPALSRARRMAATRPSIMSLGATTSAPALAWLTAVRASSSRVGSLSTSKPSRLSTTTPQWPWLVYSQRQTSAMRTSFFAAADCLQRAQTPAARCRFRPMRRCLVRLWFRAGRRAAGPPRPSAAASSASRTASSTERLKTPGMEPTALRTPSPGQMKRG